MPCTPMRSLCLPVEPPREGGGRVCAAVLIPRERARDALPRCQCEARELDARDGVNSATSSRDMTSASCETSWMVVARA